MKPLYTQYHTLDTNYIEKQLQKFYKEDKTNKDLSTLFLTKNYNPNITALLIAEEELIVAGLPVANIMFKDYKIIKNKKDGEHCSAGDVICSISGPAAQLLSYERILLNLIQRMSGIAFLTMQHVNVLNSSKIKILDTRKTTPGLRLFEKYAVCMGGGYNHRLDLFDGVMIKDNHLVISENLDIQLNKLKTDYPHKKIQLEVDTFNQLEKFLNVLSISLDAVLLDNMTPNQTMKCVKLIRQKQPGCFIESSGGINLDNILDYQNIKVDGISIGAITHQATSKNIKFEFKYE